MIFPHLASYPVECLVDGRIHVLCFCTGFDGDMPVTTQDDVHSVTIFFETQHGVYREYRRIIEMQRRQPPAKVVFHSFRDRDVPPR